MNRRSIKNVWGEKAEGKQNGPLLCLSRMAKRVDLARSSLTIASSSLYSSSIDRPSVMLIFQSSLVEYLNVSVACLLQACRQPSLHSTIIVPCTVACTLTCILFPVPCIVPSLLRYGKVAVGVYYVGAALSSAGLLMGFKAARSLWYLHDMVIGHFFFIILILLAALQIPSTIQVRCCLKIIIILLPQPSVGRGFDESSLSLWRRTMAVYTCELLPGMVVMQPLPETSWTNRLMKCIWGLSQP